MENCRAILNQNDFNFLEKLSVPSCFLNPDFSLIHASTSFLNLTNVKQEEIANKKLQDFFKPDKEGFHSHFKKSPENNFIAEKQSVFLIKKPKGEKQSKAILFIQPFNSESELFLLQVTKIIPVKDSIRPDVSDQHLFRLLLNELPDAIYFKDLQGKFFLTNRLHVKKHGLNHADDFHGKTDFDLFSEEHARQAFEDEQSVIRSGKTISKEEKETHFDGTETWASTSKMPLKNEYSKIVGTFGISKDITQIKNAEIQLRKAEKILQEANASKDKFFSILAHDLKNPFNSLIGMSEVLVEEFNELSDDEKLQLLRRLNQTSESTYALLENLLDWSRVQTNSISMDIQDLQLEPILDDVLDLSHLHAYSKNINITKSIPGAISVFADENMLRTIMRNLLSNAIKFTPNGGEIQIVARPIKERVQISVIDNGVGMDKATMEKLFKISEKVKTYGTADESGTGLGLIIIREFIHKNNGAVKVESTEGKGSKFTIELPEAN